MTVASALLACAVLVGWLVPVRLRRVDLRRRDPWVLIVAWVLSITGFAVATVTAVVLLLVPSHGNDFVSFLHHCRDIAHGAPPQVEAFGGAIAGGLVLALAIRLGVILVRGARHRARRRTEHLSVLRLAARGEQGGTLWLEHDQPLAFSMSGGVVVATEGLYRHLPAESVAAVLSHERAHVRGRHHLIVAIADAVRKALPFVPLFREAPMALRDLVEVAADDAAVRAHGIAAVRSALLCVSGQAPGIALAMAREAVDVRLARLDSGAQPVPPVRRALTCVLTGLTAAAGPLVGAAVLLLTAGLLTC
ncbi:M56 family peptidase [Kibdelosporangium aridum]|uniref:M56 family peptidase n=1 Tax=Kibdelosporangium aridum TaxID=2030 RepID=A0A428YTW8_KIBAR|nr:M56 family metallopeptidase [Kibdelosporangium aridum]RSM73025.1 M56 family peptidase [Kibdelosporangium aridum]